jgi:hypothetical protein
VIRTARTIVVLGVAIVERRLHKAAGIVLVYIVRPVLADLHDAPAPSGIQRETDDISRGLVAENEQRTLLGSTRGKAIGGGWGGEFSAPGGDYTTQERHAKDEREEARQQGPGCLMKSETVLPVEDSQ